MASFYLCEIVAAYAAALMPTALLLAGLAAIAVAALCIRRRCGV